MKLIVDDFDTDVRRATVITESVEQDDGKFHPLTLNGIFIVADKMNKNKRMYAYDELKPEVDRFIKEDIGSNRAFGDFEHPEDGKIDRNRAAVKICELIPNDDKTWTGKAVVMSSDPKHGVHGTPQGDILRSYIDYGCNLGFSTRGVGNIIGDMVRNYKLLTIDCVMDPSVGIFCEGVLESKEFMIDNHGLVVECCLNEYEKAINQSANTYIKEKKLEIIRAAWDTLLSKI